MCHRIDYLIDYYASYVLVLEYDDCTIMCYKESCMGYFAVCVLNFLIRHAGWGVHEYGIPIIKYGNGIAMIKYDVMVFPS